MLWQLIHRDAFGGWAVIFLQKTTKKVKKLLTIHLEGGIIISETERTNQIKEVAL